ncbi:MAG: hypothetical protein R2810_03545 [Flavobacteriales bacterium]
MSRNISTLSGREGRELDDSLWERLQEAAAKNGGSPSDKHFTEVADDFLIGEAITYGTSSFYDFLKKENQGRRPTCATQAPAWQASTRRTRCRPN